MLDVSRRLVVIVGGGAVAARKAKGLLDAGATRIRMISPEFCDGIPPAVERIVERYASGHLEGAGLVFAATNDAEVNAAVVNDANRLGLLVNRADASESQDSDFATPASLRHDNLVVAVSTGGSPALAAVIRDELGERLDPRWVEMAQAMKELRPRALGIQSIEQRRQLFRDMTTSDAMNVLSRDGVEGLWNWLAQRHLQEKH